VRRWDIKVAAAGDADLVRTPTYSLFFPHRLHFFQRPAFYHVQPPLPYLFKAQSGLIPLYIAQSVQMAKSARSSVKKANKSKLRARVFGPVENARTERLSAKLLQLATEPAVASSGDTAMELVDKGKEVQLRRCCFSGV
jgi:Protein of unknown function (DUF2423)